MALKATWQDGVILQLEKMENKIDAVNSKIDDLNKKDITDLKLAMVELKTQVKIYAGIAGFVGMAIGGAMVKFVVK